MVVITEVGSSLDTTQKNILSCVMRLLNNGNSSVPCQFSKIKKSLLIDLYWLSQYCLHHIHSSDTPTANLIKLMGFYNRLNDITISYYPSKEASNVLDSEVASRIRRAKNALMALDLDCEADIELAKVLNSGVVATGKVAAKVSKVDSDPWD